MPKPRLTPQQQRDKALELAIARCSVELGLKYDKDIANIVGVSPQFYMRHKKDKFRKLDRDDLTRMALKLGFTGQEVCAIFGIPYRKEIEQ